MTTRLRNNLSIADLKKFMSRLQRHQFTLSICISSNKIFALRDKSFLWRKQAFMNSNVGCRAFLHPLHVDLHMFLSPLKNPN